MLLTLLCHELQIKESRSLIFIKTVYRHLKVAGRPILMRFITLKVAVLFQQWTSVLTSSSMQFVCLSIGIDYSKF